MQTKDGELVALLARCALRDQSALKALYQRLAPFFNGVAFRILQSDALSNEVLQEAFVQIWENAGSYREQKAKPLTWMTSIVRYRAIDKLQSEQRHTNKRVERDMEDQIFASLSSQMAPERDYELSQLQVHLNDCLGQMNEKLSLVIELAYLKGYSREELAEQLDTKVNTIKSWLHRGSERLRQCLSTKIQTTA